MNFRDKQATNYLNPSVIQLPTFVTFYVTSFGTITLGPPCRSRSRTKNVGIGLPDMHMRSQIIMDSLDQILRNHKGWGALVGISPLSCPGFLAREIFRKYSSKSGKFPLDRHPQGGYK